jgi:hypothetical protein
MFPIATNARSSLGSLFPSAVARRETHAGSIPLTSDPRLIISFFAAEVAP